VKNISYFFAINDIFIRQTTWHRFNFKQNCPSCYL